MDMDKKKYRVTSQQIYYFLTFMKEHSMFATRQFLGLDGKAHRKRLLQKLTARMNGLGPPRTCSAWEEFWATLGSDARNKNAIFRKNLRKTGNENVTQLSISILAQRVLYVMGNGHGSGLAIIPEIGFYSTVCPIIEPVANEEDAFSKSIENLNKILECISK